MEAIVVRCQRCNKFHREGQECRPAWSRRGFLSMLGIGAAAAIAAPTIEIPNPVNLDSLLNFTPFGNMQGKLTPSRYFYMNAAFPQGGEVFISCGGKELQFNVRPCEDVKEHRFNIPQSEAVGGSIYIASGGSIVIATDGKTLRSKPSTA